MPCQGAHDDEVVARVPVGVEEYPAEDIGAMTDALCAPRYEAFLGRPIDTSLIFAFSVYHDPEDWSAGVRDVLCIAYASEPVRGTAASGDLRLPGATIAAIGEVDGRRSLRLIDTGSGTVRMAGGSDVMARTTPPDRTPDGRSIAFAAESGEDGARIHVLDVAARTTGALVDREGTNSGPAFSPDGSQLAFMSDLGAEELEIDVLDLSKGTITRLTDWADRDTSPRWSPDGSQLAFRRRTDGRSDIWVMNADGSDPRRLTDNGANNYDPRWSPDGGRILFTTDLTGNYDIWVMDADGSDATAVTTHPGDDEYPDWSPDGTHIAFHSDRHGGVSLWLMRADGSEQTELTGTAPLGYPTFAPAASER